MTIDQILKLAELGYTKDEIQALSAPEASAPAQPSDPEPEPEPAPAENPELLKLTEAMKGYMESMQQTLKDIQSANIRNSSMPMQDPDTVDTALAAIIQPSKKRK